MSILTATEREYLLDSMANLLSEYDYCYNEDALDKIVDTWARQKASLIEAFKKHPNYLEGKFMIAFDHNYDRKIDGKASDAFSAWLMDINGPMHNLRDALPEEVQQKRIKDCCAYLPDDIFSFLTGLRHIASRTISEETEQRINSFAPAVHAHNGQKTSRVINKLLTYLGYNKHPDYNREFAKYADSLSPLTIKRHTILSINPLDYLTMSFGNSWASCHTIDKTNKRGMPNSYSGCYSSGTISYMLDPSSMVLYTVDAEYDGDEYWDQPKITRQMYHWGEEKLVQSRLYPQDNDCDGEAYVPYRNIVQDIMSTIFDFPNLWSFTKGTSAASRYIYSEGTHYRDYNNFSSCVLSRIKGSENEECFTVGAEPICIECGDRHTVCECISCCEGERYVCADCGCVINEDDAIYIDGDHYCRDCVSYCEHCENYHRGDVYDVHSYHGNEIEVCEWCRDEYYRYCEHCEEYVYNENATDIDDYGTYVCDDCLSEHYGQCEECGDYFLLEDMHGHNGKQYCDSCYDEIVEDEEETESEAC